MWEHAKKREEERERVRMGRVRESVTIAIQWNLQQRTPPIMETSIMRTRARDPESFPIVYCILQPPYIAETSLLRITDNVVTP